MKNYILSIIFLWAFFSNAQEGKKEILLNLNLRDHIHAQPFHIEMSDDYRFVLMGIINGKKQLFNRRYTIKSITFYASNLSYIKEKVYVKKVEFIKFHNDTTKLKIELTLKRSDPYVYDTKTGVYKNTILDVEFPEEEENTDDLSQKIIKSRKGVGDHICKSRIVY